MCIYLLCKHKILWFSMSLSNIFNVIYPPSSLTLWVALPPWSPGNSLPTIFPIFPFIAAVPYFLIMHLHECLHTGGCICLSAMPWRVEIWNTLELELQEVVSTWRGWWALNLSLLHLILAKRSRSDNLSLLEEQKVPITSESPFWPLYLRFSINFPLYLWIFTILAGL